MTNQVLKQCAGYGYRTVRIYTNPCGCYSLVDVISSTPPDRRLGLRDIPLSVMRALAEWLTGFESVHEVCVIDEERMIVLGKIGKDIRLMSGMYHLVNGEWIKG